MTQPPSASPVGAPMLRPNDARPRPVAPEPYSPKLSQTARANLSVLRDALQPGPRAREQARRLGRLLAPFRRSDSRDRWRGTSMPLSRLPSQQELLPTALASLALRDLTLVETLLQLVEELEENEEDPDQLEVLFRIDHLATRMRRNGENLLVLAGQDTRRDRHESVPLLDVARAAISEITDYSRTDITSIPDVRVSGIAADDVSHLLAELLDNATSRSPKHTQVVVSARAIADGTVVLSVEDSGIGIPVERLAELNTRLEGPPVLDVGVTRHMGLYVVGRLAHRHGVRVQLQTRPFGGTTAYVVLPAHLVQGESSSGPPAASDAARANVARADQAASHRGGSAPARSESGVSPPNGSARGATTRGQQRRPASDAPTTAAGLPRRTPGASVGYLVSTDLSESPTQPPQSDARDPVSDAAHEPMRTGGTETPEADEVPTSGGEPADEDQHPNVTETRVTEPDQGERESWGVQGPSGVRAPEQHTDESSRLGLSAAERIRDDLGGFQAGQQEARREATSYHPAVPSSADDDSHEADDKSENGGTEPPTP